ncbi:MAG: nucleotide exchange factor GrpE [Bacteroidota bacterium]
MRTIVMKKKNKQKKDSQQEAAALAAEEIQATTEQPEVPQDENSAPKEDELALAQQQLAEQENRYLRLFAEFENYKKRNQRERLQLMETAGRKTMSALLPVLDDFDRARHAAEQNDELESFEKGIGIVIKKLRTTLEGQGLRSMQSTGESFDPDFHEAITEIPAPTKDLQGKVVDTVETGYTLNGTIIRHAKVVVGK